MNVRPGQSNSLFFKTLIWFLIFSQTSYAESLLGRKPFYEAPSNPRATRDLLFPPLLSFIVPGFDQWVEKQYYPATWYSGLGAAGLLLSSRGEKNIDNRYRDIGLQLYLAAGSMSLYHSFRTAVHSQLLNDELGFLAKEETPIELLEAPINYKYLGRWTTILPLLAGAGIFFLLTPSLGGEASQTTFGDLSYATTLSYMTGVGEEALFRGYVLPMMMIHSGNERLSIGASSLLFALGHGLRFKHFVTSFFFGLYAGYLTKENGWTIGEVVFIHTWWDIMAFLADYSNHREHAFLRIPTIQIRF